MPYFRDAEELHRYVGGVMRGAAAHPEVGPQLAAAGLTLVIRYRDPDTTSLLRMHAPQVVVVDGGEDPHADVVVHLTGDIADRYWRGEYNLAVGLARGKVVAEGAIERLLPLLPLTRPVFPRYREAVAVKDGGVLAGL